MFHILNDATILLINGFLVIRPSKPSFNSVLIYLNSEFTLTSIRINHRFDTPDISESV